MKTNRDLACLAPKTLFWLPKFWLSQPILVAVIIGTLLIGWFLVVQSLDSSKILIWGPVLAIHSIAFVGVWLTARALTETEVGLAIAQRVASHVARDLRLIEAREIGRVDLDHVAQRYLPSNPEPELDILRLFSQVLREAKDRKFSATSTLIQPFRESAFSSLFRLQTLQNIALQLGILGTFIGLVLGISQINLVPGSKIEVESFSVLLNALLFAFGTSVAGIEVAVLLKLLVLLIQRRQQEYFRSMEEATILLCSLSRNSINKDEYLAELGAVQTAVRQLGDRILDQTHGIATQTDTIRQGMDKLVETRERLDSFLDSLSEQQTEFLTDLQDVYETLSPKRLAERFEESFDATGRSMAEGLETGLGELLGNFKALAMPLGELQDALRKIEEARTEELQRMGQTRAELTSILESLLASGREAQDQQRQWLESLRGSVLLPATPTRTIQPPSPSNAEELIRLEGSLRNAADSLRRSSQRVAEDNGKILLELIGMRQDLRAQRIEIRLAKGAGHVARGLWFPIAWLAERLAAIGNSLMHRTSD